MFKRLFAALRVSLSGNGETTPNPAACRLEPEQVEESVVPATSSPRGAHRSPSRERIAFHAYHRWLSRGKPTGSDWEDWFDAERQLHATA